MTSIRITLVATYICATNVFVENFGDPRPLSLDIVTPTYYGRDSLNSRLHIDPAWHTGLAVLRNTWPQFTVFHRFLMSNSSFCYDEKANAQFLLSEWYYQGRRPDSVPIILTTGCQEAEYLNQLASNWNVLLIVTVDTGQAVSDTLTVRPTWINNSPIQQSATFLVDFLLRYNWTSILILTDMAGLPLYAAFGTVIARELTENGLFRVTSWKMMSGARNSTETKLLLTGFREVARVLYVLGNSDALRRLLLVASDMNMTNGEFVYITGRILDHKIFGNFTWNYGDADDEKSRATYRAVLMLGHREETRTERVQKLLRKWHNHTNLAANELPVDYLIATHSAFQMLGEVLSNMTMNHSNAELMQNGTLLAGGFCRKTFDTDFGPFRVNGQGKRLTATGVKQLNQQNDEWEGVLLADEQEDGQFLFREGAPIDWYGGTVLPPNEPFCGFQNQKPICYEKRTTWIRLIAATTATVFLATILMGFITGKTIHHYLRLYGQGPWWIIEPAYLEDDEDRLRRCMRLTLRSALRLDAQNGASSMVLSFRNLSPRC